MQPQNKLNPTDCHTRISQLCNHVTQHNKSLVFVVNWQGKWNANTTDRNGYWSKSAFTRLCSRSSMHVGLRRKLPVTAPKFVYTSNTHEYETNCLLSSCLASSPYCAKFPPYRDIKFVFLRWFQGPSPLRDLWTWFSLRLTTESLARSKV